MSRMNHSIFWSLLFLALFTGFPGAPEALAADAKGGWRPTYDLVMLWVNFGILVFLLVKFLSKPLKEFFRNRKEETEREIKRAEQEKEKALEKVQEAQEMLKESGVRLDKIKARIVRQGEVKKEQIIEEAKTQSKLMIADSRKKIDHQIITAKKKFKSEMIDEAMVLVMEKLPVEITSEDNQKYVDLLMNKINNE